MRRYIIVLTLLLTVLLQRPAAASRAHRAHAKDASRSLHAHAGSQSRHSRLRSTSIRGGHASRPHGARYRRASRLERLRARNTRSAAAIRIDPPNTQALIDPVPLTGFQIPAPLKGSHDSLVRQNVRAEADGLLRIEDDEALLALRKSKSLVALPLDETLRVDDRLPADRRYCREWTALFLSDLARVHYGRFNRPLQVNSAVRTVAFQRTLGRRNGNAAAADGDIASPHLTGATIDIAKKGLSIQEIGWMRAYLLPLETAGKLDVEEEFYQSCFHITVYKSYDPEIRNLEKNIAKHHGAANTTLLAARVR